MSIRSTLLLGIIIAFASPLVSLGQSSGFYIEVGGSALWMRGDGRVGFQNGSYTYPFGAGGEYEYFDFDVKNPLIEWVEGFGWDNKTLFGIKPQVGYRFLRHYGIALSFVRYFQKKAAIIDHNGGHHETKYDQKNLRLSGQYYFNNIFYFEAGMEWAFLRLEEMHSTNIVTPAKATQNDAWVIYYKNDDNAFGFSAGLGALKPVTARIKLSAGVLYSFTRYEGTKLYNILSNRTRLELNVGGLSAELGLRYNL
jgi:opacity protein-like surface antigen